MAAKLLWAVLPVFVVLVVAEDASTTGFQPPSPSTHDFRCSDEEQSIKDGQQCDGHRDCDDGSDENPGLCNVSTTVLAPSSRVLAHMWYDEIYDSVMFTLCDLNIDSCSYLVVFGKSTKNSEFIEYTSENSVTKLTIDNYNSWSVAHGAVPFQNGDLVFEVQRREGRFMVRLDGHSNWASEQYLGQDDAKLSVRPNYTRKILPVTFNNYSRISSCETLSDEKCDDQDDESPSLCNAQVTLAVNHDVTVKVESEKPLDHVAFVLTNDDKDSCVSLLLDKSSLLPESNENVFVVERRPLELAVWLQSNPNKTSTVPLKTNRLAKLRVLSYNNTLKINVTAPTVLEMLVELNDALRVRSASEPCIDDCLARLNSLVDMAVFSKGHPTKLTADEQWAVAWMRAAVASVSSTDTLSESTMTLAYKPEEYLEGLRISVRNTNWAREKVLHGEMASTGKAFFNENVSAKLEETLNYIKNYNNVTEKITTYENGAVQTKERTEAALEERSKRLQSLKNQKKVAQVISIGLSSIASICSVAMYVVKGWALVVVGVIYVVTVVADKVLSFTIEDIVQLIDEVNDEIQKDKELQKTLDLYLPMLRQSQILFASLDDAVKKNQVRFWLTSPEMLNFQGELLEISLKDARAGMAHSNMFALLQHTATNLAAVLKQVQDFEFQRTAMYLLTRPLHDDGPFVSNVTSLQQVTGENTLAKEFRSTLLSLRLFSFPYCGALNLATAESCLSRDSGSAMTQCVTNELSNLLGQVKTMSGTVSGPRMITQNFDVSRPFYTWSYATHSAVIKALLSGEEVVLTADVSQSPAHQYGTKFEEIFLGFRRANSNNDMRSPDVKVKMVHSGVSHFRCAQRVIRFKHRMFPIIYTVRRKETDGNPIFRSDSYAIFRAPAKPLLSPYTSWTVQLTSTLSHRPSALQELANEQLDVLLVGKGTYAEGIVDCGSCGGELM